MPRQQLHTHTHARRRKGGAHGRSQGFLGTALVKPACRAPRRKRRSCPSPAECEGGPIGRQVHTQTHARRGKAGGTHGRSTQILTRHHPHIAASAHRCLNDPCPRSHGLAACHHAQTAARCPDTGHGVPPPYQNSPHGKRGGATRNQNCSASNKSYCENIILYGRVLQPDSQHENQAIA